MFHQYAVGLNLCGEATRYRRTKLHRASAASIFNFSYTLLTSSWIFAPKEELAHANMGRYLTLVFGKG